MTHRQRGSNQYLTKTKGLSNATKKSILLICLFLLPTIAVGSYNSHQIKLLEAQKHIISPLAISPVVAEPHEAGMSAKILSNDVLGLIKKIWGKDQKIGIAIASCESGFSIDKPHVANTNQTTDEGVFSINSVHQMPDMTNATANISYAYTMYLTQGTKPWDSSAHCWKGRI